MYISKSRFSCHLIQPQLVTYSYQNTSKYMKKWCHVRYTVLEMNAIVLTEMTVKPSLVFTLFCLEERSEATKFQDLVNRKGTSVQNFLALLGKVVS